MPRALETNEGIAMFLQSADFFGLGLDYGLTTSCYDPGPTGRPCGHCDSCVLRAKGFDEVGIADPLRLD